MWLKHLDENEGHQYTNRESGIPVIAWQFTKKNFSKGVPRWIRYTGEEGNLWDNRAVVLFSQYAGEVLGGHVQSSDGIVAVHENDYILQYGSYQYAAMNPDDFEQLFERVVGQ